MNQVKKKVAFYTLGCKLNYAETSAISRLLPADSYEKTRLPSEADIIVINTCSVTAAADKKCRQLVKKLIKQSPKAFVVAAGCYAQLNPEALASIEGVDLILGTNEKYSLDDFLKNTSGREKPEIHVNRLSDKDPFNSSFSVDDRTRSFLKVQDGCDYCCSYCTVPLARGRSRNPSVESLKKEAAFIASKGVKEIVLTGVNIGDFGKSTGETFAGLLRELLKVQGIERYRISSIEPDLLTDEILELASENKKIMHHFHIPLQSACDRTLRMMGRRYLREIFAGRVMKIKKMMPLAGIGADVIAGFPGETEQDFEETYSFLKEMPVSYLHVFTFSERPGTPAEKMTDKVKWPERERRSKRLLELSAIKRHEFYNINKGKISEVLFEHSRREGMIEGFTGNYLRVQYPWESGLAGRIKSVIIKELAENGNINVELTDAEI